MTEKRYTTVELPKPNNWGIWYDGNYLSTYEVCHLLNEYVDAKKENEQLKQQMQQQEMEYVTEHHHLAEENEQLRKENQELHQLNQEYINNLSDEKKETLSEMLNAILGDDGE